MKHFTELTPSAERIVDAAEALIQQVGYNGFSYEGLAQLVGIRKPSVHYHFAAKMDLAVVVAQRYTHRFREALLRIEGTKAKAAEQLVDYAELFAQTYDKDGRLCICGMLGAESDSLPPEINVEVRRFFQINIDWLTEVFERGARDGSLKLQRPAGEMAEVVLSMLEGSMLLGRGLKTRRGPREAAAILFSHLWA